jgi:lipopolysaccharide export system protein LptA
MRLTVYFVLFLISFSASAQESGKKIEIKNADRLIGSRTGNADLKRLIGNCVFQQDDVTLSCDSAILNSTTNKVDAYGNVHIKQGDSLNIYSDSLKYFGKTRTALLYDNIRLIDPRGTLYTDRMEYDIKTRVGTYYDGGKLVDKENVLTSKTGYYFSKQQEAYFKDSVVLTNPDYTIDCDTMRYNTSFKIAYFLGPTYIRTEEDLIYCENGYYNTVIDESRFSKNAYYQNKDQKLAGDSLVFKRDIGIGEVFRNITFTDTAQNILLKGHYAKYYENQDKILVTDSAVLILTADSDYLYMHGDTLISVYDSVTDNRTFYAYYGVKIFKSNFRGSADSVVYNSSDSLFKYYYEPTLWVEESQLTADSIHLFMRNKKLDKLNMYNNAFVTNPEDSIRYNQIRGRNMYGTFVNNKLNQLKVEGNGQSVYYAKEDDGGYVGVNQSECSNMLIRFSKNQVSDISFYTQPVATFYPIDEISTDDLQLKGFKWRIDRKPKFANDIFRD